MSEPARGSGRFGDGLTNSQVLLLAAAIVLPGLAPTMFGWLTGLLAIPVFAILVLHGTARGSILIRNGVLIACGAALFLKLFGSLLFALTLIPLGYSFQRSAATGTGEWKTVLHGALYLGAGWLLFWMVYGTVEGVQPYQHLLKLIDDGFAQTYEYYREQGNLPADRQLYLEQAVNETRRLVPLLLPGVLCGTVILTVWLNLMGGIYLLNRVRPGHLHWKEFSRWRLPDWLVWPAIGAGILLLIGGKGSATLALTLVQVCGLLYFFQGLAVFIHLLERWKIPRTLRLLFYVMLIVQSYGLLLLAILGLADVWVDFRRRTEPPAQAGD
ncbi:MAG: DUF2232 domain-containing protein [Desulfobulbaceae bacterium]